MQHWHYASCHLRCVDSDLETSFSLSYGVPLYDVASMSATTLCVGHLPYARMAQGNRIVLKFYEYQGYPPIVGEYWAYSTLLCAIVASDLRYVSAASRKRYPGLISLAY